MISLKNCDIVYVVRYGEDNEALRYSLRSLDNIPHRYVYVFGYCPSWVRNVNYVYLNQTGKADQYNSNYNLLTACQTKAVSDNFIFMNDDFMVMQDIETLVPCHQGLLDDRIAGYKQGDRYTQAFSLVATRNELRKLLPGMELYSYELHFPMLMNKQKILDMLSLWERPLLSLRPRTFYGNLYANEGEYKQDVKGSTDKESEFISTITGFTGADADYVRTVFTEPGAYESVPRTSG